MNTILLDGIFKAAFSVPQTDTTYAQAMAMADARNSLHSPDVSLRPGLEALGVGQHGAVAPATRSAQPGLRSVASNAGQQLGRNVQFQRDNQAARRQLVEAGLIR